MSFQDFLLRARRPASLVAFNGALPRHFKLVVQEDKVWYELDGVNLDPVAELILKDAVVDKDGNIITPAVVSSADHYNLRVTKAWSGWDGLFLQWFKDNGVERLDPSVEHPRTGRTDMRWFRWTAGTEWVDIAIDAPQRRRRVWL